MRTVDPVKHEEKRQEILVAAKRCFVRHGLRGASIAGICTEAGISPGHLYHYFESKDAILQAIVEAVLERNAEQFSQTAANSDALAALMVVSAQSKVRNDDGTNGLILEMLAEAERSPVIARLVQEHSRGMQKLLADFLRRGQTQREIDPSLDIEAAAALLVGIIDSFVLTAVHNPALDPALTTEMLRVLIARFLTVPIRTGTHD
ncbi:TetR/AcrR family transcriptional regulator (plasmid) [Deinococcus radiomollis]|uniref:TetR/AcrR family transcriptional regulator n=1 Tax=Deinococcus radiomollis TaxID=468916 RepID=UPI0038911CA3